MFGELGIPELLFIFAIALLIFGPKKLGELGKGLGEGIRHFKSALHGPSETSVPTTTASNTTIIAATEQSTRGASAPASVEPSSTAIEPKK